MTLQDKIKHDLKSAMKDRDADKKEALRVVMGEMARLDKKDFSDEEVIKILKKLIKSEKEMLAKSNRGESSPFLTVIEDYLPRMADEAEIREWIAANVDFGSFKNKMQAMGVIMAHFGASADGNLVRKVLQQYPA